MVTAPPAKQKEAWMANNNRGSKSNRGFAAMSKSKQQAIAREGGKARARNRNNDSNPGNQNTGTIL
jgi:general stress protein YciG